MAAITNSARGYSHILTTLSAKSQEKFINISFGELNKLDTKRESSLSDAIGLSSARRLHFLSI